MMRRLFLILLLCTVPMAHADFLSFGSKKPSFLPADKAFALEVHAIDQHTLIASFKVTPSYYLYRDKTELQHRRAARPGSRASICPKAKPRTTPTSA